MALEQGVAVDSAGAETDVRRLRFCVDEESFRSIGMQLEEEFLRGHSFTLAVLRGV